MLVEIIEYSALTAGGVSVGWWGRSVWRLAHSPSTMTTPESKEVSKELAIPSDVKAPPVYEMYDHPAPPIPLLAASLPSAPLGYGWEISTTIGKDGDPALRLSLLDLATSTEVDTLLANLIIVRRWKYANDETYAQFYRRAEAKSAKEIVSYENWSMHASRPVYNTDHAEMLGKVMMANLITPMVDWARVLTLRYIVEHPDETKTNYILIESEERVSA